MDQTDFYGGPAIAIGGSPIRLDGLELTVVPPAGHPCVGQKQ